MHSPKDILVLEPSEIHFFDEILLSPKLAASCDPQEESTLSKIRNNECHKGVKLKKLQQMKGLIDACSWYACSARINGKERFLSVAISIQGLSFLYVIRNMGHNYPKKISDSRLRKIIAECKAHKAQKTLVALEKARIPEACQTRSPLTGEQLLAASTPQPSILWGAAGAGKTKTGLEIAREFPGERLLYLAADSLFLKNSLAREWIRSGGKVEKVSFMTYTELLRQCLPENLKKATFVGQAHFEIAYKAWRNNNKRIPADILKMTDRERYRECKLIAGLSREEYRERVNTESMIQASPGNTLSREIMYNIYLHYLNALDLAQKDEDNARKTRKGFQPLVNPDFYVIPPLPKNQRFSLTVCDEYLMLSLQQLRNLLNITANEAIEHVGDPNQSIHPLLCQVHQTMLKKLLKRELNIRSLNLSYRYHPHVLPGANAFVKLLHLLYGRANKMEYHEIVAAENQDLSHGWFAWLKAMPLLPAEAQNHQLGIIVFDKAGREKAEKIYKPQWIFYPEEVVGLEFPILMVDSFINTPEDMKAFKAINALLGEIFEKSERAGKNPAEALTNLARPGTIIDQEIALRLKRLYMVASRGMRYLIFCQDIQVIQKQLPCLYKLFSDWSLFQVQQTGPITLQTVSEEQLAAWAEQLRDAGPELKNHCRLTFLSIPGNTPEAFETFWHTKYALNPTPSMEPALPVRVNTALPAQNHPRTVNTPALTPKNLAPKPSLTAQHTLLAKPETLEDRMRRFIKGVIQDFSPGNLLNLFKSSNANRFLFEPLVNGTCFLQTVWQDPNLCIKLHFFLMKLPDFVMKIDPDKLFLLMKGNLNLLYAAGEMQIFFRFLLQTHPDFHRKINIEDFSEKNRQNLTIEAIDKLLATRDGTGILAFLLSAEKFPSQGRKEIFLNRISRKYASLQDFYTQGDTDLLHALIKHGNPKFLSQFTENFMHASVMDNGETPFDICMKTTPGLQAFLAIAEQNPGHWNLVMQHLQGRLDDGLPIIALRHSRLGYNAFLIKWFCSTTEDKYTFNFAKLRDKIEAWPVADANAKIARFIFNELQTPMSAQNKYLLLTNPVLTEPSKMDIFTRLNLASPWTLLFEHAPALLYALLDQKIILPGYFDLKDLDWENDLDCIANNEERIKILLLLCEENTGFRTDFLTKTPVGLGYSLLTRLSDVLIPEKFRVRLSLEHEKPLLEALFHDFSEENLDRLFRSPNLNSLLFAKILTEEALMQQVWNDALKSMTLNHYLLRNSDNIQKLSARDLKFHLRWNRRFFMDNSNTAAQLLLLTLIAGHTDLSLNFDDFSGNYHQHPQNLETFAAWIQTEMGKKILTALYLHKRHLSGPNFFSQSFDDLAARKFPCIAENRQYSLLALLLKNEGIFEFFDTVNEIWLCAWIKPFLIEQSSLILSFCNNKVWGIHALMKILRQDPDILEKHLSGDAFNLCYHMKMDNGLSLFQDCMTTPDGKNLFSAFVRNTSIMTQAMKELFSFIPGKQYCPLIPLVLMAKSNILYELGKLQPEFNQQIKEYLNDESHHIGLQSYAYCLEQFSHMGKNRRKDFLMLTLNIFSIYGKTLFEYSVEDETMLHLLFDLLDNNREIARMFTMEILTPEILQILAKSEDGQALIHIFREHLPDLEEPVSANALSM